MTTIASAATSRPKTVRAWDWPTRVFHWLLVACFVSAWVSYEFAAALGDPTLKWHRWNGYAVLVLLTFRLFWGFVGASTSRLAAFIGSPLRALDYARSQLRGQDRPFLSHNPLGSWMVVALFSAMTAQAVMGLYTLEHNEIAAGPLQRTISDATTALVSKWHGQFYNVILGLVALHILANSLYQIVKKDPLVTAMVTGRKPAAAYVDAPEAVVPPALALRAALCLAAALILVFGTITLLGGRIL